MYKRVNKNIFNRTKNGCINLSIISPHVSYFSDEEKKKSNHWFEYFLSDFDKHRLRTMDDEYNIMYENLHKTYIQLHPDMQSAGIELNEGLDYIINNEQMLLEFKSDDFTKIITTLKIKEIREICQNFDKQYDSGMLYLLLDTNIMFTFRKHYTGNKTLFVAFRIPHDVQIDFTKFDNIY